MLCHECAMSGGQHFAVALCKFCFVGLCKPHLIELFAEPRCVPQLACHHVAGARPAVSADQPLTLEPMVAVPIDGHVLAGR